MKKIIGLLVVAGLLFFGVTAKAATLNEANELYTKGGAVPALAAYRAVLPSLKGIEASNAQWHIGYILQAQHLWDEAITAYENTKKIVGGDVCYIYEAYYWKGFCLESQAKYAEAVVAYGEVLSYAFPNPGTIKYNDASAQYRIGLCLEKQTKYDEAITEYTKAVPMAGNTGSLAQFQIGVCYDQKAGLAKEIIDKGALTVLAQDAYWKVLLIKEADVNTLKKTIGCDIDGNPTAAKIDFVAKTPDDADVLLIKAYRTIANKQAKDGDKYIYVDYLAGLVSNMSQKAQATVIK